MRWETKLRIQTLLLGIGLLLAIPLVASLLGFDFLRRWIVVLGHLMEHHRFREVSGYVGLALGVFQVFLSLRKRTRFTFGISYPLWRAVHILVGVGILLVVVIHTGGRWGWNLNGWLLSAFILTVFVGLVGKVLEAGLIERLVQGSGRSDPLSLNTQVVPGPPQYAFAALGYPPFPRTATAVAAARQGWAASAVARIWPQPSSDGGKRSPLNRLRTLWLSLHIVLVSLFFSLLGFHILSVYYF
jgi:hypothetical protein